MNYNVEVLGSMTARMKRKRKKKDLGIAKRSFARARVRIAMATLMLILLVNIGTGVKGFIVNNLDLTTRQVWKHGLVEEHAGGAEQNSIKSRGLIDGRNVSSTGEMSSDVMGFGRAFVVQDDKEVRLSWNRDEEQLNAVDNAEGSTGEHGLTSLFVEHDEGQLWCLLNDGSDIEEIESVRTLAKDRPTVVGPDSYGVAEIEEIESVGIASTEDASGTTIESEDGTEVNGLELRRSDRATKWARFDTIIEGAEAVRSDAVIKGTNATMKYAADKCEYLGINGTGAQQWCSSRCENVEQGRVLDITLHSQCGTEDGRASSTVECARVGAVEEMKKNCKQNEMNIGNGNDNQLEYDSSLAVLYEMVIGDTVVDATDMITILSIGTVAMVLWISKAIHRIEYSCKLEKYWRRVRKCYGLDGYNYNTQVNWKSTGSTDKSYGMNKVRILSMGECQSKLVYALRSHFVQKVLYVLVHGGIT